MTNKKPALGRGLGALIKAPPAVTGLGAPVHGAVPAGTPVTALPLPPPLPGISVSEPESKDHVRRVPLAEVVPSRFQPRKRFADEPINELMASIREHGVIQPLIVRPSGDKFELIAGERRYRASVLLKLGEVPVVVREATDREVLEMSLIENLQREDLNPMEEAEAYVRLAKEFHLRQEDIAQKVGKSRATVANAMRLLELEESVQALLAQGRITTGHAKAILGLKTEDDQRMIADLVLRQALNVRDTEKLVAQHLQRGSAEAVAQPARNVAQRTPLPSYLLSIQSELCSHFSAKVTIRQNSGETGRIEIEYTGDEELDRILFVIGGKFAKDIESEPLNA
ncbi:MAG: ParB/RepB/Spo0J family partition protein [Verrucomicrobia bacterium]|nr:ParB/RepB/Spo0J family partition protein [Verrucomicrobiota bacterium]